MTNEIGISLVSEPKMATVILPKATILAGMTPFVGFQSAVTIVLDEHTKAWNPEGGYFVGPDTVSYLHNTVTGAIRARVGVELFE